MAAHTAPPSNEAYLAQPAHLRTLRGTQPGLLDPSQPIRLLRSPDSTLSFASFDPKTAVSEGPSIQKSNNSESLAPPKRIVIETAPKGASFWRFVPRARLEGGAQDEGVWPRVIDICGEKVQCYQEQWEMYKLDPKYLCVVYPWPRCSTVTWVELPDHSLGTIDPSSGKRSRWSSPEVSEPVGQKKARSRPPHELCETDFGSDEEEVEEMIIDDSFPQKPRSSRRPDVSSREKIRRARLDRWRKNRMTSGKLFQGVPVPVDTDSSFSMRVDSDNVFPSENTPHPAQEVGKRKGDSFPESENDGNRMSCDRPPRGQKRARISPAETRQSASHSHVLQKKRLERLSQLNRQHQQREFAEFLGFAFAPLDSSLDVEDKAKASPRETPQGTEDPPTAVGHSHEDEIAESIRKLRELEKDRPLWEEQRKKREARERAEEVERLVKAEHRRKEEEQRLQRQHEAAEREKRLAQQEAERRTWEEELCQREIRRQRQKQRWESGPWTTHRALERYRILSDEFDTTKFTPGQSITFQDIPWPVLHVPSRLTIEDVDWSAVETFFATVKFHMRTQDYKEFVEKSHRRFHPDRWRARRIWTAITDEVERGYLEVAANTVAQALTPIWRATKEK